jgi:hypothetical protein
LPPLRSAVRSSALPRRAATAYDRVRASAALTERANEHATSLVPIITRLDPEGHLSLQALAAKLTTEG